MDLTIRRIITGTGRRFSLRIPALPGTVETRERFRRYALIGVCLALAGLGTLWAQSLTRGSAWEEWESSRVPSYRAWEHGLGGYGFRKLTDLDGIRKATRKLPVRADRAGAVWVSADSRWLVAFGNPETSETSGANASPFRVFCAAGCLEGGKEAPNTWQPAGLGWPAFDRMLKQLENAPPSAALVKKAGKSRKSARDSREILY